VLLSKQFKDTTVDEAGCQYDKAKREMVGNLVDSLKKRFISTSNAVVKNSWVADTQNWPEKNEGNCSVIVL